MCHGVAPSSIWETSKIEKARADWVDWGLESQSYKRTCVLSCLKDMKSLVPHWKPPRPMREMVENNFFYVSAWRCEHCFEAVSRLCRVSCTPFASIQVYFLVGFGGCLWDFFSVMRVTADQLKYGPNSPEVQVASVHETNGCPLRLCFELVPPMCNFRNPWNVPSWDLAVTAEIVMLRHVYAVSPCATPEPQLALEELVCLCSIVQGHTALVSLLRPPGAGRLRGSTSRLHVSLWLSGLWI